MQTGTGDGTDAGVSCYSANDLKAKGKWNHFYRRHVVGLISLHRNGRYSAFTHSMHETPSCCHLVYKHLPQMALALSRVSSKLQLWSLEQKKMERLLRQVLFTFFQKDLHFQDLLPSIGTIKTMREGERPRRSHPVLQKWSSTYLCLGELHPITD